MSFLSRWIVILKGERGSTATSTSTTSLVFRQSRVSNSKVLLYPIAYTTTLLRACPLICYTNCKAIFISFFIIIIIMQVLMGPTCNMDVSAVPSASASSSSPAYVRDRSSSSSSGGGVSASSASAAAEDRNKCNETAVSSSCLFLLKGDGDGDDVVGDPIRRTYGSDELSDSSSSIGDPVDSEEEDDDESDVVGSSWKKKDGLTRNKWCMNSLEDSLLNR